MSSDTFWTRKRGAEAITTRVGSSSLVTKGSAGPFTFGSSLSANAAPFSSSCDWFVTAVPFAITPASVISNSTSTLAPAATDRLRTSSTPVPFAPPVGFVPLVLAPTGTVTSASVPGWNAAGVFRRSSSSVIARLASGEELRFSIRSR